MGRRVSPEGTAVNANIVFRSLIDDLIRVGVSGNKERVFE